LPADPASAAAKRASHPKHGNIVVQNSDFRESLSVTRSQTEELIEMTWRSEAATRADPAAWLAAMKAHDKRRRYYMRRLSVGRPAPRTMRELLNFPQFQADSAEATRLATADGFPDPSTVADEPKVEDEVRRS
jgi:hypothetical protein